jgi:hypothetical protein
MCDFLLDALNNIFRRAPPIVERTPGKRPVMSAGVHSGGLFDCPTADGNNPLVARTHKY